MKLILRILHLLLIFIFGILLIINQNLIFSIVTGIILLFLILWYFIRKNEGWENYIDNSKERIAEFFEYIKNNKVKLLYIALMIAAIIIQFSLPENIQLPQYVLIGLLITDIIVSFIKNPKERLILTLDILLLTLFLIFLLWVKNYTWSFITFGGFVLVSLFKEKINKFYIRYINYTENRE